MTTHDIWCTKGIDIRLISLISGCWIRSKHCCFQRFFKYITRSPMVSDLYPGITWIYFWYSAKICQIINWNLVNFLLISINKPLITGWYRLYPDIRYTYFQQDVIPLDLSTADAKIYNKLNFFHSTFINFWIEIQYDREQYLFGTAST